MEVSGPVKSENRLKHRPLTPLRLLRGVICLVVFLSTAFMCLVYFVPVAVVGMRLFSIRYSRKTVSFLFGLWLSLWPSLFEKINKTKVVFSGDSVPMKERVLLIANHRTEVDWMYLWDLALRKGTLGCIKYILKNSLMKLPIFGWGFHILEFIAVERKWEVDEQILHQKLSTLKDPQDPLWLALFPEGTDYTYYLGSCLFISNYFYCHWIININSFQFHKSFHFIRCMFAVDVVFCLACCNLWIMLYHTSVNKYIVQLRCTLDI